MTNTGTFSAAALLLAAPVCLVAQAETIEETVTGQIAILDDISAILEKVTPETADASVAELDQCLGKIIALEDLNVSEEEKAALMQNTELVSKLAASMERMISAVNTLQTRIQSASPEDQAKLMKIFEKLNSSFQE